MQAREGTIEEGSPAWEALSVGDRGKRKRAAEEKNLKLRSPNFSVSRTRLSLRNHPPVPGREGHQAALHCSREQQQPLIWCRVSCLAPAVCCLPLQYRCSMSAPVDCLT